MGKAILLICLLVLIHRGMEPCRKYGKIELLIVDKRGNKANEIQELKRKDDYV